MAIHVYGQQNAKKNADSAPEQNLFQPRPFAVQRQSSLASPEQQETPDLQTQLERAERFGHNFGRVQVQADTPAVMQQQSLLGQSQEQQYQQETDGLVESVKVMAPPIIGKPIQREVEEDDSIQMMPRLGWLTPSIQRQDQEDDSIQMKPIQLKLAIGQPGDQYEQEADLMASQVMRMPAPALQQAIQREEMPDEEVQMKPLASLITPLVQREEMPDEEVQMKPWLQRSAEAGTHETSSNLESQLSSSKGGGSPLPDEVRSFMEPRFGADFSQVRVHTGSEAVQMNQALGAQAFTHGSDIYYGAGKSPSVSDLTAHELTHVVQQTGDAVANRKVIQRYQAGESGHGSIEKKGLMLAGFTAEEAAEAYLGNWMRDLSQLGPDMFPLVELLGMGEFGKPIDRSKLGTYVPSEHMDNPDGGNTVEDTTSATTKEDADARKANKEQLSDSQKKDQEAADAAKAEIKAAAAKNRLPAYIERGKFMAKRKLVEAIKKGDTPEGREEMSSALHAIEDYFSHTNFTEAAIWVLAQKDPAKYKPLMAKMSKTTLGTSAATVGGLDKKGLPQIISGTYAPGANNKVSQIELLKTELESGALTVALVKGLMMKAGITADVLAQKLGEKMGIKPILSTVEGGVGAVVGGVGGAVKGAASGARTGGAAGRKLGSFFGSFGEVVGEEIGETVGGLVGGVTGGISGAKEGAKEGEEMGEQDAEAIIKAAGFAIKGGMVVVTANTVGTLLRLFPQIAAGLSTVVATAKSTLGQKLLDAYAEKKVAESAKEAKAKGLAGPTHSELAKDAPDHPLFDASASLAVEAVKGIGVSMKAAWAQNKTNPPSAEPIGTEAVTSQVDKYVCALDGDGWWRPIIEKQAAAAGITTSDGGGK
jgi:hypothetical protein